MTNITAQPPAISPTAFRGSENGHVYGIIDHPERDFPAITAELLAAGVPLDGIHIYRSCEGPATAGPHSTGHSFLARIYRTLQSADGHLQKVANELAEGHALIGVAVEDARKDEISEALRRHSGHDVVYYGKYTWQWLGA